MTPKTLLAAAAAALALAGCGGGDPAVTSTSRSATGQDRAVKFAECMRDNGVPDFPDPDPKGEFAYGVSVAPAVFQAAADACKALQPPGVFSSKRSPAEQDAGLRVATCIRANGVEDFPDPVEGEPLIDTTKIPSTDRSGGMAILDAAIAKCRRVMDEAVASP